MRRVLRSALRGLVAASLLTVPAGTARAAVPEGCVGFPDIPEAWVCITSFTPANAVPTAGTTDGTTFVVPRFCAFSECVGPTDVTVPGVYVAQGQGAIATITYDGTTVTVPVVQVPVLSLELRWRTACFGCGWAQSSYTGTFAGVINGHSYRGVRVSGTIAAQEGTGIGCVISSTYSGSLVVSDGVRSDSFAMQWTAIGNYAVVRLTGAATADGDGARTATPGSCGVPADVTLRAVARPVVP